MHDEKCTAFGLVEVSGGRTECQTASLPESIEKLEEGSGMIKVWYSGELVPAQVPCTASKQISASSNTFFSKSDIVKAKSYLPYQIFIALQRIIISIKHQ